MNVTVGELIRILLRQQHLSQAQLARTVGCSRAMVNRVVKGTKRPGPALAERMSGLLFEDPEHRKWLTFYLLDLHKKVTQVEQQFPEAYHSFKNKAGEVNIV